MAELIRQVGITEHSRIADRAYGRIGQRCPTHQVLNSNRMVAGASKLEEATMTRFQIILPQDRNPDAREILSPPPHRFWRLKAGLATRGHRFYVVAIKAVIRHVARIRDKRRRYVAREC